MAVEIKQIEYALPKQKITNADLEKEHPEWDIAKIEKKSGVHSRYIAASNETAFDLSTVACEKLLSNSDIEKNSINGIIFCTQSPDYIMPPNSFLLHAYLGISEHVFAFDYNLACSGYIYGLAMAKALIEAHVVRNVLLVNGDTYSKYINSRDRSTRILFGDAAAVSFICDSGSTKSGFIDMEFSSSGKSFDTFYIPAGGCRIPKSKDTALEIKDASGSIRSQENIHMNGFSVWHFISKVVPLQINRLLERNSIAISDVDLFVFHQASKLTLDSLVKVLGIPKNKMFINLDRVGNCVSASIPIALKDAETEGRLKKGDLVLLSGFGVGLSWGTAVIRY